jgi:UDP-glucuronate decarboxylase
MRHETRVLITGGAGFLGSHLCERLLSEGMEILCVDNVFTGTRRNIDRLLDHHRFEFIRHDVTFPLYVEVDQIYNLACPASPVHYQHDPVQTTKTSVHGAINMLGLAKRLRARILQASTSEVYGDPSVHPQTEDYWGNVNPIGPRSCYDEGKRCAETLFFDYWRQHRLQIKVARIFNTYGPRMLPNDGRVVSNFIVQALLGRDITINGDGNQTRSFCYVDDLIDGLVRLMKTPDEVTGPVNIGNPEEYSMLQLASMIIEMTGSSSRVVHGPPSEDDPRQGGPVPHHRLFRGGARWANPPAIDGRTRTSLTSQLLPRNVNPIGGGAWQTPRSGTAGNQPAVEGTRWRRTSGAIVVRCGRANP